ncbi:DUF3822 family protein [Cytophagaceae bacterium DM2B3-1]|uniref:DUF3822 family protein n=1 Tax=Xanthocytophaga flava TaxID=3048013 RepID=A0AAE3U6I2_9BACT|nr:DUF3822 family protein [Xanthocytophaga flavus]MDJ1470078.1 DUF3822 family protein [Xanthocytophaga flavus]MDJ1481381.1 DUF3822 family protein [Xanthocytophaga flavus]MDJ1491359.1 DUF3822 family protein [Xanthocytophaga flavus]
METTVVKFKQNQLIKDTTVFDIELIPQYALNLELSKDGFRISVVDTHASRCLWLEERHFSALLQKEQLLEQLDLLYEEHEFLKAGFWQKIKVSVKNQFFTLLPSSLFYKEHARKYLQLATHTLPESYEVLYYRHPHSEMVNVFAEERKVIEWFRQNYPARNVEFVHYSSALVEGVFHTEPVPVRSVTVLVESSHLTIAVTNGKVLEYCNTFFYVSANDFLYYVMLVFHQMQLNPEVHKVTLYGEISPESAIFEQLYKYIRNVVFGHKPSTLKFSYLFDELYDHRYFDVYNIYLCE